MKITGSVAGGVSGPIDAGRVKAIMASLKGITKAGNALKEQLRDQVRGAGFTDQLSKTWQGKTYPNQGLNPAAYVYSKAPRIIDAYARGATAVATGGRRCMAIPTEDTPLKSPGGAQRRGKAMTPAEVEAKFHAKLRFVPARSAQGSTHGSTAIGFLVIDNVVSKKTSGLLRAASPRERRLEGTGKARPVRSVVMFVLVRAVKFPRLFDLDATARGVAATVPQLIAESWG